MNNTFGTIVCVNIFGESHGNMIGGTLDGLPAGIDIDRSVISRELSRRRPDGILSSTRIENDDFEIVSGVFNGKSTGAPITVLIKNTDTDSTVYDGMRYIMRPSQSDYTNYVKSKGYNDYRGGGHSSGRLTAVLVALGAIAGDALARKGVHILSHIKRLHGIDDIGFTVFEADELVLKEKNRFPAISDEACKRMTAEIEKAKENGDSVGGIIETRVTGMRAGVGEPIFDSIESILSHGLFSVPGVKAVSFGLGERLADIYGSQSNGAYTYYNGEVVSLSCSNGNIEGGMSNGCDILFSTTVKPTSSISVRQETVDIERKCKCELSIRGRHDPCVALRAVPVVDAVTALCLADMFVRQFGREWLAEL